MSHEHHDYRAYAGQVASGTFRVGDEVMVLPSGFTTVIAGIDANRQSIQEAVPPMSVSIRLADDLDVSRGDMLCRPHNAPAASQDLDAMVCWFSERPMRPGAVYAIKQTTRVARARIQDLRYRLDVNTLSRVDQVSELQMNEIGRTNLRTTTPLFVDAYRRNRMTGSFILIDEATNETVGAGMVSSRNL
jgi:sulfate adenylyltransferase subunit 1 (EFTu-like GTPase family)